MDIRILKTCRCSPDCGAAIQVGIDGFQLLVIVCIGVRIAERIIIVHAGVEVSARFTLMVKSSGMTDLLTDDVLLVRLAIAGSQVRVIHLRTAHF